MNILYLANIRFPTEKAHGVQIMKACEALANAGNKIELVVPRRKTPITEDPFSYYPVASRFPVRKTFTLDTVQWGRAGFLVQAISFAIPAALYAWQKKADVVYTRDEVVAAVALLLGVKNVFWESHDGTVNSAARFALKHTKGIVVVSQGLKDFYISKKIPEKKILVLPNGVDVETFAHAEPKEAARKRLSIPHDAKVAMYAGALDGWKGTDTLLEASQQLPDILLVVIGGTSEKIETLKKKYPAVLFIGPRPYRELPDNLAAADVCVLPNTAKDKISFRFTCPLKLLTYMAAGKLIVASDLPSVREITGKNGALLVPPDNPPALAEGIRELLADPLKAEGYAQNARTRVNAFSWNSRVQAQISFLEARRVGYSGY